MGWLYSVRVDEEDGEASSTLRRSGEGSFRRRGSLSAADEGDIRIVAFWRGVITRGSGSVYLLVLCLKSESFTERQGPGCRF